MSGWHLAWKLKITIPEWVTDPPAAFVAGRLAWSCFSSGSCSFPARGLGMPPADLVVSSFSHTLGFPCRVVWLSASTLLQRVCSAYACRGDLRKSQDSVRRTEKGSQKWPTILLAHLQQEVVWKARRYLHNGTSKKQMMSSLYIG